MKKLKDLIYAKSGNKPVKGAMFATPAAAFLLIIILFAGCTKSELKEPKNETETDKVAPSVLSVTPSNNTTAVATSAGITVTFSEPMLIGTVNSETFTVKAGTTILPGVVNCMGNTATFTPGWGFAGNTVYTCTITTTVKDLAGNTLTSDYIWTFTTAVLADVTPPSVLSVTPVANSSAISTSINPSVSFSEAINSSTVTSSSFILKQGSTTIPGTITCSGSNVSFKPAATLTGNTVYTVTVTTGVKDASGNALNPAYTWSFTTAAIADVTPPSVLSVTPVANSASVSTDISPTVTFNENIDPATINSSTFTLKQGSSSVSGAITISGATATFNPAAALSPGTSYTVSVTTGVKDISGNPMATLYSWSFTTAGTIDVTPPTVVSVTPAANSSTAGTSVSAVVTFSENISSATVNSSTFTLKQGSTTVTGTITVSGSVATFRPAIALSTGTSYTVSVTTGVKDLSGNAMAADYSWSFTTAAISAKSFSADVVPILNICNTCHTHSWTTSSNASTFYTNLVSGGYVNAASYTTSKIYGKINGGHPSSTVTTAQKNIILTWMSEGSKNN